MTLQQMSLLDLFLSIKLLLPHVTLLLLIWLSRLTATCLSKYIV